MQNELVVRSYADIKPFFEEKAKEGLVVLNNQLIPEIQSAISNLVDKIPDIGNGVAKVAAGAAIIHEIAKATKTHFEAILTPEMEEALKKGIGGFEKSHKIKGDFHTMFIWKGGQTENVTLREIQELPNYSNITMLMNQMQMQQTLTSIQNTLLDFAEETNRQLSFLQKAEHDNRILKSELAKQDFETYLREGKDYKGFMLHSNNDAFLNLRLELKTKLEELEGVAQDIENKKLSFGMKNLMDKEQEIINQIIETLDNFHVLCNIEMYVAYINSESDNTKESLQTVQKKYSDVLVEYLTENRLKLLSGLSTMPKDIWHDSFMPGIEHLKQSNKELLLCKKNVRESITEVE